MLRLSTIVLFCTFLISYAAQAQIPNAGFEDWTLTDPDGWVSSNVAEAGSFPVTKAADSHSGSWALKGTVVYVALLGTNMSPIIQTGPGGHGFAVTARHAGVSLYYKCSLAGGDRLGFNFIMYQAGTPIAVGAQVVTANSSAWTQITVPFPYTAPGSPDVCILQVQIVGPVTGPDYHAGSWYELDDLALTGATTVLTESRPATYSLDQNFPNPFNPSTTIRYSVAHRTHVTLNVFNMLGEKVATLVNGMQEPGSHEARFDAAGLASGAYFYRLQ
ncbi:MAG TPA: T9SS type A sorting domain-containing protein, partial [Bacteroidota bacterium]|nr:T9SS type A sorting domain-containing protein [Bacteroidota bacterium]